MKHLGLAKAQFLEKFKRSPWIPNKNVFYTKWDELNSQYLQKRITYGDLYFVHQLLLKTPDISQNTALFVCHLLLATQEGHLCVTVQDSQLLPSVNAVWNNKEDLLLSEQDCNELTQKIINGFETLPEAILELNPCQSSIKPICKNENDFYFQKNWQLETLLLKKIKEHFQSKPLLEVSENKIKELLKNDSELNDLQKKAIENSCQHSLSIISGGPGTGKTYTAGRLIKLIWENIPPEKQAKFNIIVTAPTGKAAANLQKSLHRATKQLADFPVIQSKTLHALLKLNSTYETSTVRLNADLIIVDESSMIDLRMMTTLFLALKEGARLVFLGDYFQLPSIETGQLFFDLIQLQVIPHVELKTCLRAELESIVELAEMIKKGKFLELKNYLNDSSCGVVRHPVIEDSRDFQKKLIKYIVPSFQKIIHSIDTSTIKNLFEYYNSLRLLSPMRKGMFGVDQLNQLIWLEISKKLPNSGFLAVPIMVVSNDYKLDLFNGEIGLLIKKLPLQKNNFDDFAFFPTRTDEEFRNIPQALLPKYEYAYCLSIHKSQGSEFDRVILLMPAKSELFGREVFYTAVTRAKKQVEIFGSDETLEKVLKNQKNRLSGLVKRFSNLLS